MTGKPWLEEWETRTVGRDRVAVHRHSDGMCIVPEADRAAATVAAAAPALYRELEKCIACIKRMREWCLRQNDAKHATEFSHDVVFEAQAALWKARGE